MTKDTQPATSAAGDAEPERLRLEDVDTRPGATGDGYLRAGADT